MREHSLSKTPVIMALGKREAEERAVLIRRFGSQDSIVMPLNEALDMLEAEVMPPDVRRGKML